MNIFNSWNIMKDDERRLFWGMIERRRNAAERLKGCFQVDITYNTYMYFYIRDQLYASGLNFS